MTRRKELCAAAGLCLVLGGPLSRAGDVSDARHNQLRIASSISLLGDVNLNDARAAIRSWADAIVKETGLQIDYDATPLTTPERLIEEARKGSVDAFGITVLEYMQLAPYIDKNLLLIDQAYAEGGLEYLLLVHEESGIKNLADLRGRQLTVTNTADMCLEPAWLESALAAANLGPLDGFFHEIITTPKLSRAVLPVYFHQMDACLVTRHGFAVMCEMNPQLFKKLRVILISPKLVPVLFAFHKDCPAERKKKLKDAMIGLPATAVGKQIMTLFQTQGVFAADASVMKTSIDIVKASQRIKARAALAQGKRP
jgi:ABC-type phosphate/phosphonate transport system substrate-binding protein